MKKKILTIILVLLMAITLAFVLCGCRESEKVNYNMSKEADNFNVTRRIVVINARTDKPMFELEGNFSLSNNDTSELIVTCEVGPGEYKKHYIYLNEWTLYVVEDISGAYVSQYHYEVNYLPEMILPVEFTSND